MNDMNLYIILVIWVAVSAGVSYYATTRGRTAAKWFFIALFLSPLLAFALLRKDSEPPPAARFGAVLRRNFKSHLVPGHGIRGRTARPPSSARRPLTVVIASPALESALGQKRRLAVYRPLPVFPDKQRFSAATPIDCSVRV
jgi:hypothetical protein